MQSLAGTRYGMRPTVPTETLLVGFRLIGIPLVIERARRSQAC